MKKQAVLGANTVLKATDPISVSAQKQYEAWRKSSEGVKQYNSALEALGLRWKGTGLNDDSQDGGPLDDLNKATKDMSWLNDLGQRLKLFKESSFNALDPLNALKKFLEKPSGTRNNWLEKQQGAIKEIEAAAKAAKDADGKIGITLDKDFMEIIRGMDAEQFKLWSETLFKIGKKGDIQGLTDQFKIINEGFKSATISTFIDNLREENRAINEQIQAYDILNNQGWSNIEIQRVLADKTMAARIVAVGSMKAYTQESE
jgi:hypothetical protein